MNILEHLEQHLGTIARGWRAHPRASLQVVCFDNQPIEGVRTYATLRLSDHDLAMSRGRTVRQELVLSVRSEYDGDAVASFLLTFAETIIERHEALLRGDVAGPFLPIVPSVRACGVFVAVPVVFDEPFHQFADDAGAIVIAMLLPVMKDECEYIARVGWERFEEQLDAAEPDLFDLDRPSIPRSAP